MIFILGFILALASLLHGGDVYAETAQSLDIANIANVLDITQGVIEFLASLVVIILEAAQQVLDAFARAFGQDPGQQTQVVPHIRSFQVPSK